MRDKLAHQYWRIDVEVIWKAVTNDLPKLKLAISEIIEDMQI
ncbi:HepT-like ribonuclease domain-containing protein [Myxosarcina sp. GI1(2024)]